jgi:peptidyl-prolyl cis-trans isomerase SurA
LSEIYFEKTKESVEETYKKIEESIKEIGFQNTANLYSVAESAKFGGKLPWVQEKNLTDQITKILNKKTIGSYTKPIIIGNKFLILNIDDVKNEKIEIDEKKELEKMIKYETNRQLGQFSKIYYDKVKINTVINEL